MSNTTHAVIDPGIRCIVEPTGTTLTPTERAQLADLRPAGIMLRKRNVKQDCSYHEWLPAYADLLSECRAAIGRSSLVVAIDHEGGAVHRFPQPITRFPYAATYGSSTQAVFEVACAMGEELAALGINLSFSPVADIHSNPANPVINERAYGTTPQVVCDATRMCARGLRQSGVVPCAKHFPGHGDTANDSHYDVPVVTHSLEQLRARELLPFKALIEDGIEIVMTAHLMVPAIDPHNQATISRPILSDVLRGELGFRGLTIADALGMRGIHGAVTGGSFPVLAHQAGLDLFLVVGDTVSMVDALTLRDQYVAAVSRGTLAIESVLDTERRIQRFLETLPQHGVHELPAEAFARHAVLAQSLASNAPWSSFVFHPVGFE